MSGGTKTVADSPKYTEKYVERAHQKAKNLAKNYIKTHSNTHLEEEDFVQEAMIAFLQGRSMIFGMIDAYRSAAPLARSQIGKIPPPIFWQIFDLVDDAAIENVESAVLVRQLQEAIQKMGPTTQDVMDRYYFRGETFEQVGQAYNKSRTWASNLINGTIRKLRKELLDD